MNPVRVFFALSVPALCLAGLLGYWHWLNGFDPTNPEWWYWIRENLMVNQTLPPDYMLGLYGAAAAIIIGEILVILISHQVGSKTLSGNRRASELHGSARWAKWLDVWRTGLFRDQGVVVGGFNGGYLLKPGTRTLRHDGPEHIMCFAPTRSGKGVGLVLPTLLSWQESVLVLDIKGENHALTAGYRASLGHKVIKFEPAAIEGSHAYNPLAEIRVNTGHVVEDCQNVAMMIIDPDGKGLKDYWAQSGFEWLAVVVLHVLHKVRLEENRIANLRDVNRFMSAVIMEDDEISDMDGFEQLLEDMKAYDHENDDINDEVKRGANKLKIKAAQERSGVHSSASVPLALYADPIVSRNIGHSDFCLDDLMNGETPTALYIVIPPSDIDRLRPLIRILMNQFLKRLTSKMEFAGGRSIKGYKHRLLLMLDEFTSIGKMEIFDKSLAYMAGYGLKAFIIVQDINQLNKEYGKDNAIMANCHVRIAYAPNTIETARILSSMAGKTTIVMEKKSMSGKGLNDKSISISLNETSRDLLTPDECMGLPGLKTDRKGRVTSAGDMLIFVAGNQPIYGRQVLYFQNKTLLARAQIPAPLASNDHAAQANDPKPVKQETPAQDGFPIPYSTTADNEGEAA